MKKKTQALLKQFTDLRTEAAVVRRQDDSARNARYKHFAQLYFWWLPAEKTGVLDKLYKQHTIQFKRPGNNRINFVPLIKLVWNKKVNTGFADRWSRALNEIHGEVRSNPDHYKKNGVSKLASWIGSEGGPSKLSGYFPEPESESEARVSSGQAVPEGLAEKEIHRLLLKEATVWYSTPARFINGPTPPMAIKSQGFGLGILHNDATATHFISPWISPATTELALADCYRRTFASLQPPLRLVAELIHLRSVPWSLAKVAEKVRKSSLEGRDWRDLFTLRSAPNDILISPTKGASGVVLTAPLPPNSVIPFVNDLFLPRYCVNPIERELLLPMIFNLITVNNGQGFLPLNQTNVATQSLQLAWKEPVLNKAAAYYPGLQLPPIHLCPFYKGVSNSKGQVQCHGFKGNPTFSHSASPLWVQKANVEFFDEWVTKYGAKANREVNLTLAILLDPTGIRIDYEYYESAGYDSTVNVKFDRFARGQATIIVRSTDFAFMMRQIADLALTADLIFEASPELIKLRFSTAAGDYTCWIPSCNKDGVRSATGFSKYAHQVTPETDDDSP